MSKNAGLAQLMPESLADIGKDDEASWQQRKSLTTRKMAVEAALQVLAEFGYTACSLQTVAKRARISRGAMLHHYTSKLDLMAAVIEYAFYRRLAVFLDRIRALSEDDRTVRQIGIRVSFDVSQTAEYKAFLELHIASRTDPELRAIFLERASLFDRVWRDEITKVFPEWLDHPQLALLDDLVWVMIDGLALNVDIWADQARVDRLLGLVSRTILAVRSGRLD
ncbi:TetR/AcrR family transcriptional regulator [Aquisediminimonas sediminicola]|uniref:TetR/AcrR family transcriptional regulator n=1 Tax=Alteraquisediminimonas sediminicola TaxID=2676787 RepID=UPI001C8ED113|nr:TetR/AcrR family transcriptional regulator [Aquisediminimonas sediminicola]